ncbi:Gamma-aminobutyric acid type B receptor subunit 2 [Rhizophlyctis rosea]|uniref:Gamma-aminobutyric acid type B receptor subunit 2 n=1 Tax=Rhizophlyctis rosea TaxID=64517 RepID=A0AAD5SA46_9FUNG|nr:Gamma-aminobutyric acid type B receptor subunit 2 [Rhizophlyctis rosea]
MRFPTAFLLLLFNTHALAQRLPLLWDTIWDEVPSQTTGRPVKVTDQHPLPAGFDFMDVYEVEIMAQIGSAMGFWFRNGFMDYLNDKYEAIVLYLKVGVIHPIESNTTNIGIKMKSDSIPKFETKWLTMDNFTTGTLNPTEFTRIVVPLDLKMTYPNVANSFFIGPLDEHTACHLVFAGYVGWKNGTQLAPPRPIDDQPQIPNDPWSYETLGQTYAGPDTGLAAQWLCEEGDPLRHYGDLRSIRIQPYRDTNVSIPLPMDTTTAMYENGFWKIDPIWGQPRRFADSYHFPHPTLICAVHNADFIEIGDPKQADYTLIVWAPFWRIEQIHVTAAYADWVKQRRRADGTYGVAVHLRTRVEGAIGTEGSPWVSKAIPNCTDTDPKWQCPDHIWFKDSQMGELHLGKNRLASLTKYTQKSFKQAGFNVDISLDFLPVIQPLVTYTGQIYAIPVSVDLYPWMFNKTTLTDLNLKLPPPHADWGGSWWSAWNMTVFKDYLKIMSDNGYKDLLPLPSSTAGETEMFSYVGFPYGATLFNTDGRCGLDEAAERALNETLIWWKDTPGVLQPRVIYPNVGQAEAFEEWKNAPLKDPLEERLWSMGDVFTWAFGDPNCCGKQQPGVSFENGFGNDLIKCKAYSLPLTVRSLDNTYAQCDISIPTDGPYDALLVAIARNNRLHVNAPTVAKYGPAGGVSGYKSAKYTQEYIAQGDIRGFYDDLLDQVVFMGHPLSQYPSYGLLEEYNPMQLAFNEILFKNVSAKEAVQRACVKINYATMPPCGEDFWYVVLEEDPNRNVGHVTYKWRDNHTALCRSDLSGAKQLPAPLVDAVPTTYIASGSSIGRWMIALSILAMLWELILFAGFMWYRSAPVIRAASITASGLILIGSIITQISVPMRTTIQTEPWWPQCFGTYWFFGIGFATVLGSLAVKTYRVDAIFRNQFPSYSFSDRKVLILIALVIGIEVVILLIYQFWLQDPVGLKTVSVGLTSITVTQQDCPVPHKVTVYMLYGYNALIMGLAILFAARTRNVSSAYNENAFTVIAIGLICVMTIIIVPTIHLVDNPEVVFLLISTGTMLGSTLSTLTFAVPKLLIAYGYSQGPTLGISSWIEKTPSGTPVPEEIGGDLNPGKGDFNSTSRTLDGRRRKSAANHGITTAELLHQSV